MRAIGGTNYVVFSVGMFILRITKYKISLPERGNFVDTFTFSKVGFYDNANNCNNAWQLSICSRPSIDKRILEKRGIQTSASFVKI